MRPARQSSSQMFMSLHLCSLLLPLDSAFKPHIVLDHRAGSVAMAPLWHTGVSHSSPGLAVAAEAKLPAVFGLTECMHVHVCLPRSKPTRFNVCSLKFVENRWQVLIPLSGKSSHTHAVAWSPSCCARIGSLKMWQVFSLLSASNAICGATL